jgi:putative DNA primase/helicase
VTERPIIETHDLDRATDEAWDALVAANVETDASEFFFRHGDRPCRFEYNDNGQLVPMTLTVDRMRNRLTAIVTWQGRRGQLSGAPFDIVKNVLATPNQPLPVVARLVGVPVLGRNGRIHDKPGYSADHRVFYEPDPNLIVPKVNARPPKSERRRALELLRKELMGEFPFVSDAERAHALCMVLQPFLRDLIDGPTPLYLVEAPTAGTGKGLLAQVACRPAIGKPMEPTTAPGTEDEWRKKILSTLLESPVVIFIDNLNHDTKLDSSALSSVLTTTMYKDRVLGLSDNATLPNRALWIGTGNNPWLSGEITRRVVRIRLDARVEHPEDRTGFTHPDLEAWADEHRGDLVWAALTLARAWIAAGRPKGSQVLGSFESWAKVMGGVLQVAGVEGFLENLADLRAHSGAENSDMYAFLSGVLGRVGEQPFLAKEVPLDLMELAGVSTHGGSPEKKLGRVLAKYKDRRFGDLVLVQHGRRDGRAVWRVAEEE